MPRAYLPTMVRRAGQPSREEREHAERLRNRHEHAEARHHVDNENREALLHLDEAREDEADDKHHHNVEEVVANVRPVATVNNGQNELR